VRVAQTDHPLGPRGLACERRPLAQAQLHRLQRQRDIWDCHTTTEIGARQLIAVPHTTGESSLRCEPAVTVVGAQLIRQLSD